MSEQGNLVLDQITLHRVGIERYSHGVIRDVVKILDEASHEIEGRLAADLVHINERGHGMSLGARKRLTKLLATLKGIVAEGNTAVRAKLDGDLAAIAKHEAQFAEKLYKDGMLLGSSFGVPSPQLLASIVKSDPFQGDILKNWASKMEANQLQRLRTQIQLGMVQGESVDQIVKRIRGVGPKGLGGVAATNRRGAEALVRTAVNHVTNRAHYMVLEANPEIFTAYRWVSVLDERTTPICRSRAGEVYKIGEGPIPPAHWNCLPGDALVTTRDRITAASKRWFEGDLVVVRTASGRVLRATPNHPVLTDIGWQPAHALDLGRRLICDLRGHGASSVVDNQDQHVPARIEDVAEAFLSSRGVLTVPMPAATEDFHGEGRVGEVAIVGTDCGLRGELDAAFAHRRLEAQLQRRAPTVAPLGVGDGHAAFLTQGLLASAGGSVGGLDEEASLARRRPIHPSLLLLPSVPQSNVATFQDPLYGTWTDAEAVRDAADAATSEVFFDDVVGVEFEPFHGLVFNLEVGDGLILADGLVTHNCRSTIAPIVHGMDNEAHPDYDAWLHDQPADVVVDILGPTRAALFIKGQLPMKGFVNRAGDQLTLEQLRIKEKISWAKAFGVKSDDLAKFATIVANPTLQGIASGVMSGNIAAPVAQLDANLLKLIEAKSPTVHLSPDIASVALEIGLKPADLLKLPQVIADGLVVRHELSPGWLTFYRHIDGKTYRVEVSARTHYLDGTKIPGGPRLDVESVSRMTAKAAKPELDVAAMEKRIVRLETPKGLPSTKDAIAQAIKGEKPKGVGADAPGETPAAGTDAWWQRFGQPHLFKSKGAANVGGAHAKEFFEDAQGALWLFKPVSRNEAWRGQAEAMAYQVQRYVDPRAIEVRYIEIDGRPGSIQRWQNGLASKIDFDGVPVSKLSQAEAEHLQREHVVDWLIGNHDSHDRQFLRGKDGHVWGIDKAQAFKHLGNDKLDIGYHPNAAFGEREPIYNTMFRALGAGEMKLDAAVALQHARTLAAVPDDVYTRILMPYAEGRFPDLAKREAFLKTALDRKRGLTGEISAYYDRMTPGAIPSHLVGIMDEVERLGWQGKALPLDKDLIEDHNVLAFTVWRDGKPFSVFQGRLREEAERLVSAALQPHVRGGLPATSAPALADPFHDALLAAVKTLKHHADKGTFDQVNASKVQAALATVVKIKEYQASAVAGERAMAAHYLPWVDKIEDAVDSAAKAKALGQFDRFVWVPPAEQASVAAERGALKVTSTGVREEQRQIVDRRLEARGKGSSHGGTQYDIDFGDGVTGYYRPWRDDTDYAWRGGFEIVVPGAPGKDALAKAVDKLEAMGIKAAAASPADLEIAYLQRQAVAAAMHKDAEYSALVASLDKRVASVEERVGELVKFWERRTGVTDLRKSPRWDPDGTYQRGISDDGARGGRRVHYRFDVTNDDIMREMPHFRVYHRNTGGKSNVDLVEQVLDNGGVMMSQMERVRTGSVSGGMSTATDRGSGGAQYFFTRITANPYAGREGFYWKPSVLRRLDAVTYLDDEYGRVTGTHRRDKHLPGIDGWKKAVDNTSNETLFKSGLSLLEDLDAIVLDSPSQRDRIIAAFKQRGITHIDGLPVEQRVHLTSTYRANATAAPAAAGPVAPFTPAPSTAPATAWELSAAPVPTAWTLQQMKSAGQLGAKPTFTSAMLASYAKKLGGAGLSKEGIVKSLAELSEKELEALYGKFNTFGDASKHVPGKATMKLQPAAQAKLDAIKEATTAKPAAEQAKKSANAVFETLANGAPKVPTYKELAAHLAMTPAQVKLKAVAFKAVHGGTIWQAQFALKHIPKDNWPAALASQSGAQQAVAAVPGLSAQLAKITWKD